MTLFHHEFLTSKETQQLLRVSESTIARWIADGTLPSVKVGGRRLVPRHAVDSILQAAFKTSSEGPASGGASVHHDLIEET